MKRTGPTSQGTNELIQKLRILGSSQNVKIWSRIADELEKPARNKRAVNIAKLAKVTKDNDTIIVPGKILGAGSLEHKLTVSAYQFSRQAKEKLEKNSKCLTLSEMMAQNPKGKNLRIIG